MNPKDFLPKTQIGGYSVKGVKSWEGREGIGTNATLLKDGVEVGELRDDGNGGQWSIHPMPPRGKRLEDMPPGWYRKTMDELTENCSRVAQQHLPAEKFDGQDIRHDSDSLWAALCDAVEELKRLKAAARKKTVFIDPKPEAPEPGERYKFSTLSALPDTDAAKDYFRRHPGCVVLNAAIREA